MAELKANNQKPNFDNNPKLIEAIAEMRKNFQRVRRLFSNHHGVIFYKIISMAFICTF